MEPPAKKAKVDTTSAELFSGVTAYILQTGIGKARSTIFKKQIGKNGGEIYENYGNGDDITHIIIDENMEYTRLLRILKIDKIPDETLIVKSLWLSNCIKEKCLLPSQDFELKLKPKEPTKLKDPAKQLCKMLSMNPTNLSSGKEEIKEKKITPEVCTTNSEDTDKEKSNSQDAQNEEEKRVRPGIAWQHKSDNLEDESDPESDYQPSDTEDKVEDIDDTSSKNIAQTASSKRPLPRGNWVCAQASSSAQPNLNKDITDKLQAMAKTYENTNDKWRALGYSKAIAVLKKQPKKITTWEEAKSLPGVGAKLADKIWEIVESGELQKLNEISSTEEMKTLQLFTQIWGAGAQTARVWIQQGFRTLEDLRTKANLTRHQKIGLQYYDDLSDRMSREEAGQIEQVVKEAALELNPGLIAMACGSYRRGKATCGDVDVLVTHPDGRSHKGIFQKLLQKLRVQGFLTDDLVTQEDNGAQCKYLGVCKLPGQAKKHRRLDIIVVPYDEYACAVMYFTGSAHFNRSMRNLAGKMGMSLSEHSLNTGVVRRRGEKLNKGTPLTTPTEESVFQQLGLKYRPPTERDH